MKFARRSEAFDPRYRFLDKASLVPSVQHGAEMFHEIGKGRIGVVREDRETVPDGFVESRRSVGSAFGRDPGAAKQGHAGLFDVIVEMVWNEGSIFDHAASQHWDNGGEGWRRKGA